jgi:hypothetical protein
MASLQRRHHARVVDPAVGSVSKGIGEAAGWVKLRQSG